MDSGGVGVIRASKSQAFKEAEVVAGMFPWATHFVLDSKQQVRPVAGGPELALRHVAHIWRTQMRNCRAAGTPGHADECALCIVALQ